MVGFDQYVIAVSFDMTIRGTESGDAHRAENARDSRIYHPPYLNGLNGVLCGYERSRNAEENGRERGLDGV